MARKKRLRRSTAILCITPAVISVLLFNIIQEPVIAIALGGFNFSDILYLIFATVFVIFGSLLINQVAWRVIKGRRTCPPHSNPIISWEWALFASVIFTYPLSLSQQSSINIGAIGILTEFLSTFVGAVVFSIVITFLWLFTLRILESRSKSLKRFLDKLEIVTDNESFQLILISAFIGVSLRFIFELYLISQFGITSPIL